ncbi:MAG: hypothetical protein AB8F95_21130 [Bacteroidia bacterium]
MKTTASLLLFLIIIASGLFSQKVQYKKGVILVDGVEWAKMKKKGNLLTGRTFILKTIDGTEVAIAKEQTNRTDKEVYFNVVLKDPYCKVAFHADGLSAGGSLAKAFVEMHVIVDGKPSLGGNHIFCMMFGDDGSNKTIVKVDYALASRDMDMPIFVGQRDIMQGGIKIGSFVAKKRMEGSDLIRTVSFFLPSGARAARVTMKGPDATEAIIFTDVDKSQTRIRFNFAQEYMAELAKWLVDTEHM